MKIPLNNVSVVEGILSCGDIGKYVSSQKVFDWQVGGKYLGRLSLAKKIQKNLEK